MSKADAPAETLSPCWSGPVRDRSSFLAHHSEVDARETEYLGRDRIAVEFMCRACGETFADEIPRVALKFPVWQEEEPKP